MTEQVIAFIMLVGIAAWANIRGFQCWVKGKSKILSAVFCLVGTYAMILIYRKLKGWL